MDIEKIETQEELAELMARKESWLAEIPFHLYRGIKAANFSSLKAMERSPRYYKWMNEAPEFTAAMNFGSAFHLMMEGEADFLAGIAVKPKFDMRRKEDKAQFIEWEAKSQGKILIDQKELETIYEIKRICDTKDTLRDIRAGARSEVSGYYTHPYLNIPCKFRMDLCSSDGLILDYKTTVDASESAFRWSARKFAYHMQAAFYIDGFSHCAQIHFPEFMIAAVEKTPPHDMNLFQMTEDDIHIGREKYIDLLHKYKKCTDDDHWPGYTDEIKQLKLY